MQNYKINDQLTVEKMDEHYCLVKSAKEGKRDVQLCFYSIADALAYTSERQSL
ncbi:hypothetical protein ACFPU1_08810 [Thalassorhabdus alkalitolerans]|uniref:Uncharacterized protein n=1 Tax=Thalassorhabdus alkalitolerans TaxID=2282697 RepID=A0ABW0YN69_9BACI|nr:hypothetical protein [Thalassobacillus sp. C254]